MADHDHVFKLLFAQPRLAGELVREFLPGEVARELDAGTLEPFPADHLSDKLEVRVGDLVWRLRLRDGGEAYLLLEFQSRPDPAMALRMLVYAALLAQGLVRRGGLRERTRLPPIVPVVLYNGERQWRAPQEVSELFGEAPAALSRYGPRQRHLLLDVGTLPLPAGEGSLVGLLFRLERDRRTQQTWEDLEALRRELARADSPELDRAFALWLLNANWKLTGVRIPISEGRSMFERALARLAADFRAEAKAEGKAEGFVQGEAAGLVKGQAKLLLRQLALKFGPLDGATRERVGSASADQLILWGERLLVAPTLAEVFSGH